MKKAMIMAGLLLVMGACKKQDANTTKVTTEEVTKVDTIEPKVRTETAIKQTTETDSGKSVISTGGVKVEHMTEEKADKE